ncbi:hypothetical protein [Amycolatopsis plumensis]|uniref:Uncharacterized protein n=1 Tax=Amycolatopsis plumensis TaxID=236508 RepID=A0ABV5UCN9_9PSEU
MEMQVRGWREERTAWAFDTTGRRIPIVTGLTTSEGRTVAVLAVADGPSVILDGDASQLRTNIVQTLEDLKDARRAGR